MKISIATGLLIFSVLAAQSAVASGKFFQHSTAEKSRIDALTKRISEYADVEKARVSKLLEEGKHEEALRIVIKNPSLKAEISKSADIKIIDIEALATSRPEAVMALVSLQSSGAKEALSDFGKIMKKISNDTAAQEVISFIAIESALKDSAKTALKEIANAKDVREAIEAFGKSKGEDTDTFPELLELIRKCLKA